MAVSAPFNAPKFADYITRAESIIATMTAESHRKDAIDYCNRAFEVATDAIGNALLSARDAGEMDSNSEEWRKLYYYRPAAHVWSAKHRTIYAAWPELVAYCQQAADLRAKVKAAPLVPKQPSKRQQTIAADLEKAMTCQVCGRPIQSNGGLVAHHGYQRPGMGWQTDSCMGARHVPFEVSRDVLGQYIEILTARLDSLAIIYSAAREEKTDIFRAWKVRLNPNRWPAEYDSKRGSFNRRSFDAFKAANPEAFHGDGAKDFDHYKAVTLAEIEADRFMVQSYRREAQGRYDAWKGPTHKFNADSKEWESLNG